MREQNVEWILCPVGTVKKCMKKYQGIKNVVFNVFKDVDLNLYRMELDGEL